VLGFIDPVHARLGGDGVDLGALAARIELTLSAARSRANP
jgi:hypothetical protein